MFLKTLTIETPTSIIRKIHFHKGINLIVDETTTESKKESGNNVGKTTVIRLIDFCLGGKGHNIYKDPEFKNKSNLKIENFLNDNKVLITLVLKDNLDDASSREIEIKRNFLMRKEKIILLNGDPVPTNKFDKKLKYEIFKTSVSKPTFRQIISKNIRDEKNRLVNTVRTLHQTTTIEEYESLYLFWLGVILDESERKQILTKKKNAEEDVQKRLTKDSTLSQVVQSLSVISDIIVKLKIKKDNFNINKNYEEDVKKLNDLKENINLITTKISSISYRKDLIKESVEELQKEKSEIDYNKIKNLYEEAEALIPNLQKTFEETLLFHNNMVEEKRKYITEELPVLNEKFMLLQSELTDLLLKEKYLTKMLSKSDAMNDYKDVVIELNKCYEEKGKLEERKRIWDISVNELTSINTGLENIGKGISALHDLIQERVREFNVFFTDISNKLYGENFILSADIGDNGRGYELKISSLVGNPGTGKKKGEIAAFDLAHIQFSDSKNLPCLHFILQDQIENIHSNQITSIFTNIVNNINCQYVLPVLRDKLPDDFPTSDLEIVSLSQQNKLFKV